MSQENLELVRSIYAAWERGDFTETYWVHPEVDFQAIGDGPSAGRWEGLDGMANSWREWLSAFQDFQVEAVEYRALDGERVLVVGRFGGRGRTSGVEIGQIWTQGASVFHLRAGQVTRLVLYTDYRRAVTDLGLSE